VLRKTALLLWGSGGRRFESGCPDTLKTPIPAAAARIGVFFWAVLSTCVVSRGHLRWKMTGTRAVWNVSGTQCSR